MTVEGGQGVQYGKDCALCKAHSEEFVCCHKNKGESSTVATSRGMEKRFTY